MGLGFYNFTYFAFIFYDPIFRIVEQGKQCYESRKFEYPIKVDHFQFFYSFKKNTWS